MRPKSIALFEGLSLVAVALAALAAFLTFGGSVQGASARASAGSLEIASTIIGIVLSLVLVLLTSRRRSNVAKWVLVLLVAVSVVMTVPQLGAVLSSGLIGIVHIASIVLQAVAVFFLFTPEARAWLAGRGTPA